MPDGSKFLALLFCTKVASPVSVLCMRHHLFQVKLRVVTKNLQRAEVRFQDCLPELDAGGHDLNFMSETWRSVRCMKFSRRLVGANFISVVELLFMASGFTSPFSLKMISDICFPAISARLCIDQFNMSWP